MTEFKVYKRANENEISALHIEKSVWESITDNELQEVINKWLNLINFKCYFDVTNKDCQPYYGHNIDEKVCIIDNGVEIIFTAYQLTYTYDICDYRPKRVKPRK